MEGWTVFECEVDDTGRRSDKEGWREENREREKARERKKVGPRRGKEEENT